MYPMMTHKTSWYSINFIFKAKNWHKKESRKNEKKCNPTIIGVVKILNVIMVRSIPWYHIMLRKYITLYFQHTIILFYFSLSKK